MTVQHAERELTRINRWLTGVGRQLATVRKAASSVFPQEAHHEPFAAARDEITDAVDAQMLKAVMKAASDADRKLVGRMKEVIGEVRTMAGPTLNQTAAGAEGIQRDMARMFRLQADYRDNLKAHLGDIRRLLGVPPADQEQWTKYGNIYLAPGEYPEPSPTGPSLGWDTTSSSGASSIDPANVPLPPSRRSSSRSDSSQDPANIPLPPSPLSDVSPTSRPLSPSRRGSSRSDTPPDARRPPSPTRPDPRSPARSDGTPTGARHSSRSDASNNSDAFADPDRLALMFSDSVALHWSSSSSEESRRPSSEESRRHSSEESRRPSLPSDSSSDWEEEPAPYERCRSGEECCAKIAVIAQSLESLMMRRTNAFRDQHAACEAQLKETTRRLAASLRTELELSGPPAVPEPAKLQVEMAAQTMLDRAQSVNNPLLEQAREFGDMLEALEAYINGLLVKYDTPSLPGV